MKFGQSFLVVKYAKHGLIPKTILLLLCIDYEKSRSTYIEITKSQR